MNVWMNLIGYLGKLCGPASLCAWIPSLLCSLLVVSSFSMEPPLLNGQSISIAIHEMTSSNTDAQWNTGLLAKVKLGSILADLIALHLEWGIPEVKKKGGGSIVDTAPSLFFTLPNIHWTTSLSWQYKFLKYFPNKWP